MIYYKTKLTSTLSGLDIIKAVKIDPWVHFSFSDQN